MKTEQKKWFALQITVDPEAAEAVEFALNELDALGTEINNLGKKQQKTLTIAGYFNERFDESAVRNQLDEALRIYNFSSRTVKKIEWREIENADWLHEWKKHWKPTETEKFIIAPTWEKVENTGKIIIWIEPNMAFGTGTHETTRLCLKAIGEFYKSEMSFLDVGTGTGILAIAAAKFRNQNSKFKIQNSKFKIVGCDTDEDSIKIARENAEINKVGDEIEFFSGSIADETPKFDFVCANLTLDVISPMLSLLLEKSRKITILSGILKEQENSIIAQLKDFGVENPKIEAMDEWISVLINK